MCSAMLSGNGAGAGVDGVRQADATTSNTAARLALEDQELAADIIDHDRRNNVAGL
jgi:hypothetical protein